MIFFQFLSKNCLTLVDFHVGLLCEFTYFVQLMDCKLLVISSLLESLLIIGWISVNWFDVNEILESDLLGILQLNLNEIPCYS